jgi:fructokinase
MPNPPVEQLFGAIEAGGTKFVCAVGTAGGRILDQTRIATADPGETMAQVAAYFRSRPVAAIGIGSFGPLNLDPESPRYGWITSTPKQAWAHFDLLGAVRSATGVSVAITTDVNAAALAEHCRGAGQGLRSFLYVTVGTGIGGAAIVDGALLHGLSHLEMGHVRIPHDRSHDAFEGICPYHGDCLEGLASGPAMEARWKSPPADLPEDHPAWTLEAEYLALGCANWICTLMPRRIILGGGAMRAHLFPNLRRRVRELLNGYLDFPEIASDGYLVPSPLEGNAGVIGALVLAAKLIHR